MTNTHMLGRMCVLVCVLSLAAPQIGGAQVSGSWSPTPADCQMATDSLGAASPNFAAWTYLNQCGASGAAALATGIAQARLQTDTTYLDALLATARVMQDSSILISSLSLAEDAGATVAARALALDLVLAEYKPTHELLGAGGWSDLISTPRGSNCGLSYFAEGDYAYIGAMPANMAQRIADAADTITNITSNPQVIRDLASCVRRALLSVVPVTVPASALQFTYVCGNKFRASNTSTKPAQLTYDVVGQTGSFGLAVPAGGSASFITAASGDLRVYQWGQLLVTITNGNSLCP